MRSRPLSRRAQLAAVIAAVLVVPLVLAAQTPPVWTIQELFTRNVGTPAEQNAPFPPHRKATRSSPI